MERNETTQDSWDVALLLVESSMNLIFIPFSFVLGYICYTQKKFHPNFRTLLQMANIGNFLMNGQRFGVVIDRLLYNSQHDSLLVSLFTLVMLIIHLFAQLLYMFSWTALSLERVIATYSFRKYEQFGISKGVWIAGVLFASVFLFCLVLSQIITQNVASLVVAFIFAVLTIIMIILLPLILQVNKKVYATRHTGEMNVGSRYQLDENIRATRYLLPSAIIVVVSKVCHCCLMGYSILFTDVPLGTDTSVLGHVYDLLSSSTRLSSTAWLVLTNEKLHLRWSRRRSSVAPANSEDAINNYFQELNNLWNYDQQPQQPATTTTTRR